MPKQKKEKNYEAVSEAHLHNAHMPARKARLVCDLIRGKSVGDALRLLQVTHKPSACPSVLRLLKSARANAEKAGVSDNPDSLIVGTVFVDGGAMQKRMRAAPMGRGVQVRKRSCHITIRLTEY
jgi:large subunit ribosomal protein L22